MTYGSLKLRLTQMFPSVSLDLIEGFINDRYAQILGELPWSRMNVESRLVTTAPYTTGTVAVTFGSQSVTLTSGTWTAAMSGLGFKVTGRNEFYEFSFSTATTGTIDRPYEGTTSAAASYQIFQSVYPLPSDCVMLQDEAFPGLLRFNHNDWSYRRTCSLSTPTRWSTYMEDGSTPPRLQVELWPVPSTAVGLPFTYVADATALTGTSTIIKAWIEPTALIEGVVASVKRYLGDYAGAQLATVEAERALSGMRKTEARGLPAAQLTLATHYTSHRSRRWQR